MFRNRKTISVVTPQSATTPVISVADMKNFMRVDITTDDALIEEFIRTATEHITQYIRRSITVQTLELTMDSFGANYSALDSLGEGVHDLPKWYGQSNLNAIDLPFPSIVSITSITTYDRSNTSTVLSVLAYTLDTAGRVYLNNGYNWPTDLRDQNAVVIRYIAGWGYTNIPLPIRQAIRQYAAAMYDCRRMCDMSQEILTMLEPWRVLDPMGIW